MPFVGAAFLGGGGATFVYFGRRP